MIKKVLLLAIYSICFYSISNAQKSGVKGIVRDLKTGEAMIGATVFILEKPTVGTMCNFDGTYELEVEPGTYTLVCSFISYEDEQQTIVINPGQTTTVNFSMKIASVNIGETVIVARRVTGSDLALLSTMKTSEMVISGISEQQIKRSQDGNAAAVVKRVPGVTIAENRFVMIRGLSERYNPVILHDVYAPSMETDIRSFSFDIIPSSLIDRILIYKSPSAELPGDFAGGVVKIYTKNIPNENSTSASISTSYREGTSFRTFNHAERGNALYYTSFNNGYYDLPNDFPLDIRRIENKPDQIQYFGRSLQNAWIPESKNSLFNYSASVNFNRRYLLKDKIHAGQITSINYRNSKSIASVYRKDYNAYDFNTKQASLIYNFEDNRHSNDISLGVLSNWAIQLNSRNVIEFKNLFNQLNKSEYIHRTGRMIEHNYYANNHSFYQIYRGIYSGQITGNHTINKSTSIDWVTGFGFSYRDEPDYRRFRSDYDTITGKSTLYVPFGAAQPFFLGRYYSFMKEYIYTGSVNLSHKFREEETSGIKPVLNTGFFYEYKTRYFSSRNIGYVRSSILNFDNNLLDVSIDSIFKPENINNVTGIRIDEQSNPSDSYSASNNMLAYYASFFLPLTQKFNVTVGTRAEINNQKLNSFTLTNDPVIVDNTTISILPSVNFSYAITPKMLARLAYGKTVNRPEFRELAPFGFYDFNYNLVKKGSDTINIANIHNYDLRWEFYPSGVELISVGIFYKRFLNPIETSFVPGGGSAGIKTFTYANAEMAESKGVEIEIRKNLADMFAEPMFTDNFSVLFNTTIIRSSVELGAAGLGQNVTTRSMYGQSPFIVNAGIFYEHPEKKINANFMYNIIGKRIYLIGYDDYPDIYEMPRNMLDFTFTKEFKKNIELKFGIQNLLNADVLLIQDGNQDGVFDKNIDQVMQEYKEGRSYSLGISYKF